jgi:hypothetical protein
VHEGTVANNDASKVGVETKSAPLKKEKKKKTSKMGVFKLTAESACPQFVARFFH